MRDSLSILSTETDDSVTHYGVMGMKWGVRKSNAKLAGVSFREYNRQLKANNRKAKLLGKQATIADRLSDYTDKKSSKIINKYGKKRSKEAQVLTKAAMITQNRANEMAREARYAIKEHHKALIHKYGGTNVSNIKYDRKGRVNEKVRIGTDYMRSFAYNTILVDNGEKGIGFLPKSKNAMVKDAYTKLSEKTMRDVRNKK